MPVIPLIAYSAAAPSCRLRQRERCTRGRENLMAEASRLVLSGVETVADVAGLADRAREALAAGGRIVVDIRSLERADFSIVQLVIALARSAHTAGIGFNVEGDLAPLVAAAAGSPDLAVLLGVV